MESKIIFNRIDKKVYTVPVQQFLILTNINHFKAAYLRETSSRLTYNVDPLSGYTIPLYASINIPSLGGEITYESVLNGDWVEIPDTKLTKVLYRK